MFGRTTQAATPTGTANVPPPADSEPLGDVYVMPTSFRPAPPVRKSLHWAWYVVLGIVGVAILTLVVYLVVRPTPAVVTPTPQPVPVTPTPTPVPEPTPELQPQATAAERDRARYRDVRNVQAALELYFADVKKYPLAPLPLILGADESKFLGSGGFAAQAQGTSYLDAVPQNPVPGGTSYLYESLDGSTYAISFRLEEGTAGLTAGDHRATPSGLDGTPPVVVSNPRTVSDLPPTADSDSDGLTDAEEPLFGTDPAKPDSDGDGFLDGAEVQVGFDPAKASGAKLAASEHLATYTSQPFGYAVRYPKTWTAKAIAEEQSEVLFSGGGEEFIEVVVVSNPDHLTAPAWYAKQAPGLTASEVPTRNVGSQTWALSIDGLNAYLATDRYIITLSYNVGTRPQVSFAKLFRAAVDTFTLPQAAAAPAVPPEVKAPESGSGTEPAKP